MHTIISLDAEKKKKNLWQYPIHLRGKSPGKIRDIRDPPKHNKDKLQQSYGKRQIKWNRETLKAIPLTPGTRQSCPLPPCLFNLVLEVLARSTCNWRRSRGYKLERESHSMVIYICHLFGFLLPNSGCLVNSFWLSFSSYNIEHPNEAFLNYYKR